MLVPKRLMLVLVPRRCIPVIANGKPGLQYPKSAPVADMVTGKVILILARDDLWEER